MKFLPFIYAVGVIAEIGVGYEALQSSSPDVLSLSLAGAGIKISPNPFKRIAYSDQFRVLKLDGTFIKAPSSPNVLLSPNVTVGRSAGYLSKLKADYSLDVRVIAFACVTDIFGFVVPVPCTVFFQGFTTSGFQPQTLEAYTGDANFAKADLQFDNLRTLTFAVIRAGNNSITGEPSEVSLVLDNVYYTLHDVAPPDEG